jgi:hypothetical protein
MRPRLRRERVFVADVNRAAPKACAVYPVYRKPTSASFIVSGDADNKITHGEVQLPRNFTATSPRVPVSGKRLSRRGSRPSRRLPPGGISLSGKQTFFFVMGDTPIAVVVK